MGRFDGVDLGTNATFKRMAKSIQRNRADVLNEAVNWLSEAGQTEAAQIILRHIETEAKEVEHETPSTT